MAEEIIREADDHHHHVHDDGTPCPEPCPDKLFGVVAEMEMPRLALVVSETGELRYFSTLSTEDTIRALKKAMEDVERYGARRAVRHMN